MRRPEEREAFIRRLAAVPELDMQRALWAERFESDDPSDLLALIARVLDGVRARSKPHREVYVALLLYLRRPVVAPEGAAAQPSLANEAIYGPRRALYEAAVEAGQTDVSRMLLAGGAPPAAQAEISDRPPPWAFDRDVTLGQRRNLARTANRQMLPRLLVDPDTGVLRNLLDNISITEQDVLQIATRRPTIKGALEELFAHRRWGRRPAIQNALVQNPYTPVDLAVGLLVLLDQRMLKEVIINQKLSPIVRRRAEELRSASSPVGGPGGGGPLLH